MDKEIINVDDLVKEKESKDRKFNILSLLSGKGLKILILCIVCLVAFILFVSVGNDENKMTSIDKSNISYKYKTTMEYCSELETKLENVLSQIKGAGQVKVMLSVDGSPEFVYATDSDTKVSNTNNGSTTTSSTSPIIVQTNGNSEPLILTENLPIVKGVIVVSSGASDIGIKIDILQAVSTLLDISTEKISVLKGV